MLTRIKIYMDDLMLKLISAFHTGIGKRGVLGVYFFPMPMVLVGYGLHCLVKVFSFFVYECYQY